MIEWVLAYLLIVPLIAMIPPMVARERGVVEQHKNIAALSIASVLFPPIWLVAIAWAIIEKPSAQPSG